MSAGNFIDKIRLLKPACASHYITKSLSRVAFYFEEEKLVKPVNAEEIVKGTMKNIDKTSGATLVIWTKDGKTLYFENVTGFTDALIETGDRRIAFNYSEVSTGANRYANFNTSAIMGFALEK